MIVWTWDSKGFKQKKNAAIACFANGRYTYVAERLYYTVQQWNPEIPVFIFNDYKHIQSPTQEEDPYAFKIHAIETVHKKGYDIVLWCDSVLQLTQSLDKLIEEVEQVGVYLAEDIWKVGMFANDKALSYYGISRDDAMNIPSIWACFMGFDFRKPITQIFITKWKEALQAGLFRGKHHNNDKTESEDHRCKGHRHDQTCAELIAYTINIPLSRPVLHPEPSYNHRYFRGREW
jgi:hypothetical protein